MHLCRGNFRSSWIAQGGYEPVAELLFNQIGVDGYFMEFDTERAGGFEPLRFVPKGKTVVLGLVTSKTGALESVDELERRIADAAKYRRSRAALPQPAVRLRQHRGRQLPHRRRAVGEAGAHRRSGAERCGASERARSTSASLLDRGRGPRTRRLLTALAALAVIFDGFDIQILGFAIPSLMREWHVARSAFGPVLALGLAGMAVGSPFAGYCGDRFGRRPALIGCVTLFGLATVATSFVHSVSALAVLRFVTGLGAGGALPECQPRSPLSSRPCGSAPWR